MSSASSSLQTLLLQLEDSLVDARLSDDEKRALGDALRQARLPEEGLRQLRNQAFELARQHWGQQLEEAAVPQPLALVRWLEGVVRALDLSRAAGGSYRSQAWFSPGDECRQAIEGQLRTCRAQADICVFTLSDDRISREVLAAHRRGVAVRLIADNDKALD
ncbi:MAG: phospholipase D-like domain-containing protein, partial [Giesbergeria sp.]